MGNNSLSDIWFANTSPYSMSFSFAVWKLFSLNCPAHLFLFLLPVLLLLYTRSHCQDHEDVSYVFLSRSFMILILILKSLIHFELLFLFIALILKIGMESPFSFYAFNILG